MLDDCLKIVVAQFTRCFRRATVAPEEIPPTVPQTAVRLIRPKIYPFKWWMTQKTLEKLQKIEFVPQRNRLKISDLTPLAIFGIASFSSGLEGQRLREEKIRIKYLEMDGASSLVVHFENSTPGWNKKLFVKFEKKNPYETFHACLQPPCFQVLTLNREYYIVKMIRRADLLTIFYSGFKSKEAVIFNFITHLYSIFVVSQRHLKKSQDFG